MRINLKRFGDFSFPVVPDYLSTKINYRQFLQRKRTPLRTGKQAKTKQFQKAEGFILRSFELQAPKKTVILSVMDSYGLRSCESRQMYKDLKNKRMRERRKAAGAKRY